MQIKENSSKLNDNLFLVLLYYYYCYINITFAISIRHTVFHSIYSLETKAWGVDTDNDDGDDGGTWCLYVRLLSSHKRKARYNCKVAVFKK